MYSKQKQPTSGDFNIDDIDALLNSNLDDGEQDVDMNDPDLLKQLQELSSPSTSNKPKTTMQPKSQQSTSSKDMHIDIDSYVALAQGDDSEDVHVEFNDNDMNDPNLLSELSSLSNKTSPQLQDDSEQLSGLVNMGFSVYQAKTALEMFDNDIERAANYLLENGSSVIETESSDPMNTLVEHKRQKTSSESRANHEEEEDPQEWQKKAKEYQHLALEAKRQGDKKKAVALLRESKSYQQKYDEFASVLNISQEQSKDEPVLTKAPTSTARPSASPVSTFSPPSSENATSSTAAQNSSASSPLASPLPHSSSSMSPSQTQEILSEVIKLQKQYKEAAIHYKKLGNLSVAKTMVRTSKDLLHTGIGLKDGTITTPPVLPSAPDMNLGDGKIRQVQEFELSAYDTSYEQMEAQLTYQINICHNLSAQQQNSAHQGKSKKTSTVLADSHQINAYAKLERAFSADLMVLQTNKSNISSLHFEQVSYVYKNIIDSVPDNMMQFKVIRALNLPTLDISTKLDCFVTWDFGGWPPENTAQAAMNKGETPIVSGTDPQFDFEVQIPISRTNRSFMRYLQRKKLTIEVC
ncbi:hypothetical protein EDC96DRAFT_73733 [Choanephora cucurbitarum]|nr:hypothetical protein EDC96DRAFT_73733 [Choanephora cucurbitarum]